MHYNELKQKEVVDALTGVRLGEIVDLEIDMQTGLTVCGASLEEKRML